MKKVYAMITTDCNLSCPHCNIPDNDGWNEEAFMDSLIGFEGQVVFFGGEPTLYRDRLYSVLDTCFGMRNNHESYSITTNLVELDDQLLDYLELINYVGTSWNKARFSPSQYHQWKRNLHTIDDADIHWSVLVTLTPDLILRDPKEFMDTVYSWGKFTNCTGILLEHLVFSGADERYYTKADEWMAELWKIWNLRVDVRTFYELNWWFDCSETYTLLPDGTMKNCCPTGLETCKTVPNSCLTCDKVNECKPCVLQPGCSYPHKLYELIKEDYKRYERYSQK